jgi:hypothetical protein
MACFQMQKYHLVTLNFGMSKHLRNTEVLVFPLVNLEISVQLNTGDDLKVMLQDLSFEVSSAFQSSGSTSQFHSSVCSDAEEWETIWGTINKVVKVECCHFHENSMSILTRRSEAWNMSCPFELGALLDAR